MDRGATAARCCTVGSAPLPYVHSFPLLVDEKRVAWVVLASDRCNPFSSTVLPFNASKLVISPKIFSLAWQGECRPLLVHRCLPGNPAFEGSLKAIVRQLQGLKSAFRYH